MYVYILLHRSWVSQWKEMIEDPKQKIGRPRCAYFLFISSFFCRLRLVLSTVFFSLFAHGLALSANFTSVRPNARCRRRSNECSKYLVSSTLRSCKICCVYVCAFMYDRMCVCTCVCMQECMCVFMYAHGEKSYVCCSVTSLDLMFFSSSRSSETNMYRKRSIDVMVHMDRQ